MPVSLLSSIPKVKTHGPTQSTIGKAPSPWSLPSSLAFLVLLSSECQSCRTNGESNWHWPWNRNPSPAVAVEVLSSASVRSTACSSCLSSLLSEKVSRQSCSSLGSPSRLLLQQYLSLSSSVFLPDVLSDTCCTSKYSLPMAKLNF